MKTATILKSVSLLFVLLFTALTLELSAQVTYTDSVCAGTLDKVYGISSANPNSTFNWYISDPTAGTVDNSITTNNSEIQIDWGTTVGTYTIYAVETTEFGCVGDSVQLDVVLNPLPTATIAADTVCEGFAPTLTVTLTGTAPWTIDYTDGSNTYSTVANSSPHTVVLNPYTTSQTISVTGVTDDNDCDGDNSLLPSTPVVINPKANTGSIYHY